MIKALGYFIEIIRGIFITTRHFVVNLFFRCLAVLGIKTKRKGSVTIQYPEQKKRDRFKTPEFAPSHDQTRWQTSLRGLHAMCYGLSF